MKKFLFLSLLLVMLVPAQAFACEEECVPRDEATEETAEEELCPVRHSGMVYLNATKMRHALLMSYVNKLEKLGGTYQEGWNRFDVMKAIFEIQKASK